MVMSINGGQIKYTFRVFIAKKSLRLIKLTCLKLLYLLVMPPMISKNQKNY